MQQFHVHKMYSCIPRAFEELYLDQFCNCLRKSHIVGNIICYFLIITIQLNLILYHQFILHLGSNLIAFILSVSCKATSLAIKINETLDTSSPSFILQSRCQFVQLIGQGDFYYDNWKPAWCSKLENNRYPCEEGGTKY